MAVKVMNHEYTLNTIPNNFADKPGSFSVCLRTNYYEFFFK